MRADLHLHTLYSDGIFSPSEIARRLAESGVTLCSFTDHDSMEGEEEKQAAAEQYSLTRVRGWEVSSYQNGKVHMLGYRCERNAAYFSFLKERTDGAFLRAEDARKKANAYFGLTVSTEDVAREHTKKDAPMHTMHVVRAFAKALCTENLRDLYTEVFAYGKPAYSDLCRPDPFQALEIIHATGGITVLAHPGQIRLENSLRLELMDGLASRGLDGIECFHSTHTAEESAYFQEYANARGLLVTGGSDFHADNTPREVGIPEFYPSDRLLAALLS